MTPERTAGCFALTATGTAIALFAFAMMSSIGGISTAEMMTSSSERNAMVYADKLDLPAVGVACSSSDSNNDGYVSCTFSMEDSSRVPIECNYDRLWMPLGQQTGCKSVVVVGNGFQAQAATQ